MWRSLHKQTLSRYFSWAGQISCVFLWCCWRRVNLSGNLFRKKTCNGHHLHWYHATRRCLAAVATDASPRSVSLTPVAVQEQTGFWLRASSAAVATRIHHGPRAAASWGSCGRRSVRSSCLWARHSQPLVGLAMPLSHSWPLISSLLWFISSHPRTV